MAPKAPINVAKIHQLCEEVKAMPQRTYYLRRSTRLARVRCRIRHIPLLVGLGHAYEHIWSRADERLETIGKRALVCHICWKVKGAGSFGGFLPNIVYGSSPSTGRRLPVRRVDDVTAELERLEQ